MDSVYADFEVADNAKRTYEVNLFKELTKHGRKLKYGNEYNCEDVWHNTSYDYKKNNLSTRDSLLERDYKQELRFIEEYTSKNG